MHKRGRTKDVSPSTWDFSAACGRCYDAGVTDHNKLAEYVDVEALREATEEVEVGGMGIIASCVLRRLSETGEVLIESDKNVEFATVFKLAGPDAGRLHIREEGNEGITETCDIVRRLSGHAATMAVRKKASMRKRDGNI